MDFRMEEVLHSIENIRKNAKVRERSSYFKEKVNKKVFHGSILLPEYYRDGKLAALFTPTHKIKTRTILCNRRAVSIEVIKGRLLKII